MNHCHQRPESDWEEVFDEKIHSVEWISNYQARGQIEWDKIKNFLRSRILIHERAMLEAVEVALPKEIQICACMRQCHFHLNLLSNIRRELDTLKRGQDYLAGNSENEAV